MTGDISPEATAIIARNTLRNLEALMLDPEASFDKFEDTIRTALGEGVKSKRDKAVENRTEFYLVDHEAKQKFNQLIHPRDPLKTVTDADILVRPDPEWWVNGIIQKDTDTLLAAMGGLGKSFVCMHMTRSMAAGMPVFGRSTQRAKTLYLVAEGASAFGKRTRAWNARYPIAHVPEGAIQYVERGVNLSLTDSVDELREVFREGDFDILVIDTFSQLSGTENENQSQAEVINAIRSIREVKPGASSIIVHHTDAAGSKARGSTTLRDNVDALWMMKPDRGGFSMSSRIEDKGKMKDGKPEKLVGFKLVEFGGSAVIEYTGNTPSSTFWEPVSAHLSRVNDWVPSADLRAACGIADASGTDYDQWKKDVAVWVRQGLLEKEGTTRATRYRLAEGVSHVLTLGEAV